MSIAREQISLHDVGVVKTKYWHLLDDERVQCDLCPRECKLHDEQRGLCFVRACVDQQIVLTTYGRSSGFCIDPIEKKPLNHFLPGTPVFSFGTAGCNLACKFCQNWDISKSRQLDTLMDLADPERIAMAAEKFDCSSVAYTYNDPVIFHEYAIEVADACHQRGIRSVAVTAAYVNAQPRTEFYRHMDAVNVDLKAFTEKFYWKQTGSHLQAVLESIEYIHNETDVWMELTTLLIPGLNDSEKELNEMTSWVMRKLGPNVPMHFSAFHPDYKMTDIPATPLSTLQRARKIAIKNGIRYAYIGNAHDVAADSTYCHSCGSRLIERDWYVLGQWALDESGCCVTCGAQCAGIFEEGHGTWGAKRQPVRLAGLV